MAKNPLDEFLELFKFKNSRDILSEENVMLHIRARGLKNTTRITIMKIVLLGTPLRWILNILTFPLVLYQRFVSLVITVIFIFSIWYFYQISVSQILFLSLALLALLNVKSFSDYLKCVLFDLGDIITCGLLTNWWLRVYFSQSHLHKTWLSDVNSAINLHIFVSRELWGDHPMKREGDQFFDKMASIQNNDEQIKKLINDYWQMHRKE